MLPVTVRIKFSAVSFIHWAFQSPTFKVNRRSLAHEWRLQLLITYVYVLLVVWSVIKRQQ